MSIVWTMLSRCAALLSISVLPSLARGQALAERASVGQADPLAAQNLIQVTLVLVGIVAFIMGAAWLTRRVRGAPFARGDCFKVIGAMPLGPRERLLLVRVGDQQLLLGVSPGRIASLQTLDRPLELDNVIASSAQTPKQAMSFAGVLTRALGGR
jgi:flagellar protein FliO/FliZ